MSDSKEPEVPKSDSHGGEDYTVGWLELLASEPGETWANLPSRTGDEKGDASAVEVESREYRPEPGDRSTADVPDLQVVPADESANYKWRENAPAAHDLDNEIILEDDELMWLDEMETVPDMNNNAQENDDKHPFDEAGDNAGESYAGDGEIEEVAGESLNADPQELPEDPDDAISWLEQLAAKQGAPAEELSTAKTADAGPTDAIVEPPDLDSGEIPEDPDEAMAWLERLAARQGASEDELMTTAEPMVTEQPIPADEVGDSTTADTVDTGLSDDLEQALGWLEELTVQRETVDEVVPETGSITISEEPPTPAVAHDVVAAMADADQLFAEQETAPVIPDAVEPAGEGKLEDSEDAMAWLEQLAARQGAPIEELTSLEEEQSDDQVLEDTVPVIVAEPADEPAVEEDEVIEALVEAGSADEDELMHDTADLETIDSIEGLPSEFMEVADAEGRPAEDLAWLDTLGTVDAEGWLEAEATVDRLEELPEVDKKLERELPGELEAAPPHPVSELAEVLPEAPEVEELEEARQAIREGAVDTGLDGYSALVEKGELLPFLIDDLETVCEERGAEPKLQRVLGDAYARNGQLDKALQTYREALDNL